MSAASVAIDCALRRTRTRKGRALAIVVAIAIGIAGLILVSVAGTIAGDRALQRGIEALDPEARVFTTTFAPAVTPSADDLARLDAIIAGRLSQRGLGSTLRTVEYRALAAGDGRIVRFAGLDDLAGVTRLIDGEWPARCDAGKCEVVAIVDDPGNAAPIVPLPDDSPLGLTVVGTAVATSDLVLSGQLRPASSEVIMLTEGVVPASELPALELFRRTYAWQAPVVAAGLRSTDIDPLLDGVRSIAGDPALEGLHVSGPEGQLRSVLGRTRITGSRLAVPIGALLVLFFGVAALAGLGGRIDHRRAVAVLRRRGANGRATVIFRVLEAGLPVVLGTALGLGAGLAVGAWLGERTGLGGGSILRRSLDGSVVLHIVGVAAAAFMLIVVVLSIGEARSEVRRRVLASDVAGVAALVMLFVLVERGSISAASLSRGVDPTLVAVPILAAIAVAAVVIRFVPVVLRLGSLASPRRWPLTKLTLAEATVQPLRSIATASLIAVTVMFALLTFGFASTLRLGSRDQAAFAVPYDFRLQIGDELVRPQTLAPEGGWTELAPGTSSTDVLRRGVALRVSPSNVQTVEMIGLDPGTLGNLHGWREGFGAAPARLASGIDQPKLEGLGSPVPADAVSIELAGSGFEGLHTSAVIARTDGTWHELTLDEETAEGVRAALSPGDAGGDLIGLRLAQPADVSARIEHHVGEGNSDASARPVEVVLRGVQTSNGDGRLTSIDVRTDLLQSSTAVLAVDSQSALHITGSLIGVAILVTPPGPGRDEPLEAVVDPITARAARDGVLVMETSSGTVRVRPTAVAARFPGVGTRFAVVDIDALQPALDLLQPGAGTANEVWLASDTAAGERVIAERLRLPVYAAIDIDRRATREHALATDPLSIVTLLILTASALVAVVLGAVAVLLGAAADAVDDRPVLRMLALERVRGWRLVAMVAGKSLAVVLAAIPLGLIGGRWLLQIATRLVAVSATSSQPNPALQLSVPWALVAVLCISYLAVLVASAAAGALSARRVPGEDLMRGTA